MNKFRPHLTPALKSGLAYGGGLAVGNLISFLIFSIASLEKFAPGNDGVRLVAGVLLAFVISGLGAGIGSFFGGKTLPLVDPSRGKWEYAWKSAVAMGIIYGLLLYPMALVVMLFSFYNIGGVPVILFMILFAIVGAVFGLVFGLFFGGWTMGIRHFWRVAGYSAVGFGLGGVVLGAGVHYFVYSFSIGQFSLMGRIAILASLVVFGLLGGSAVAMAYARYAAEPFHKDKPIFSWLTPAWRWIIVIGVFMVIFLFVYRPLMSSARAALSPQDANLSTILVSKTVGTHWLDPDNLSETFNLSVAEMAQIDVADDGQVGLTWVSDGSVMTLPGVWDMDAKMTTWQAPITVSSGGSEAGTPQIAFDRQGQAHLVWAEGGAILYSVCSGVDCSPPETISDASSLSCVPEASVHLAPAIAISADDAVMLVWETDTNVLPVLTWSAGDPPLEASGDCVPTDGLSSVRQPRVAAAVNGRFGLVFVAGIDDDSSVYEMMYDGGWGDVVEKGNGRYPEIYFDSENNTHTIWCNLDGLAYQYKQEEIRSRQAACFNRPQVSVDSNRRVHVLWYGNNIVSVLGKINSDSVLYEIAQYDKGVTLPTIVHRVGSESQPAITVDNKGTLHMVSTTGSEGEQKLEYQAQVQYTCEGYKLTQLAQVLYDVTRQEKYRDPDTPVPFCQNRYENLVYTPEASPAYTEAVVPLVNGAFDQMAQVASTAEYEVLLATMWYDSDFAGESPGFVIANTVADLYNQVKAHPEDYPRGLTVRILLGNPPELATGDFSGQLWSVLEDIQDAGVPEMTNQEIGWNLQVADYKGAWPHSHTKLLVVDGKTAIAAGYNMTYEHYSEKHPSGQGGGRNDLGIEVTGPVAQDSVLAFDELWVGSDERACTDFDPIHGVWQATCYDFKATGQHVPEVMKYYVPENGDATAFSMFRNVSRDEADWQVANALSAAQTSIDTMQVNFTLEMVCDLDIIYDVCTYREALPYMEGLLTGAENGADVRILIKGAPVDGIESAVALAIFKEEIGKRGLQDKIEVRYFDGPMHYKSIDIDGELVIVGSQNFHYSAMQPLSGLAEYNLGVLDAAAVSDYNSLFEYHWEQGAPSEINPGE